MAPRFVKPYIKSNKNDMRDAEGIGEAVTRPTMRFVPTKEVDQQDIQALHRVHERLIGARTALVNEIHGLLHAYGIVVPKGVSKFRQTVVGKLEADKAKLTPLSQEMFGKLIDEFAALEQQLAYDQEKLEALATTPPECQHLMTIPGIGPLTATALVAAVSDTSAGRVSDLHFPTVCAMLMPSSEGERHGIYARALSPLSQRACHQRR
jgi:transposase